MPQQIPWNEDEFTNPPVSMPMRLLTEGRPQDKKWQSGL